MEKIDASVALNLDGNSIGKGTIRKAKGQNGTTVGVFHNASLASILFYFYESKNEDKSNYKFLLDFGFQRVITTHVTASYPYWLNYYCFPLPWVMGFVMDWVF